MAVVFDRLLRDCRGSTAIEYALIGSIVSVAIAAVAMTIGSRLGDMLQSIVGYL